VIGLAMFAVPEPVNTGAAPHGGPRAYLALFKNKAVRKLLWADLLLGVAPGITGSLLFFFFGQIKGYGHTEASLFMLLYFIAGLVGAPFWAWLATKIGKDKALAVASLVFAAFYIGATLVPGGNFALTAAAMFIAGLPYAAGLFLLRAMMADVGDEVRLETGVDRTGLMFSILSATTKIGHVVALIPYLVLQGVGFQAVPPVGGNSETSLLTLQILFILVPGLLLAAAAYFIGAGVAGVLVAPPEPPSHLYWWFVSILGASAGGWLVIRTIALTKKPLNRALFGGLGTFVLVVSVLIWLVDIPFHMYSSSRSQTVLTTRSSV
jgi:Na+/melibiose symporter-like transporter